MYKPKTLFEKVWDSHVVLEREGEPTLLYIDLHLVHEVTSPQAFEGLRLANRTVRRPDLTFATIDHNIPTTSDERFHIKDQIAAQQIATLRRNCAGAGIPLFDVGSGRQGIVHVIGPELGLTQPGMTVVCGDSHTSTHGAFGALAFGVGTSEVEHVLATQCVSQKKPRSMRIGISGALPDGTSSKDLILEIIRRLGTDGGTGHVIEYAGEAIRGLTMEERMTMCNMSIECGARAGMVAPDETTFAYLDGRPYAPPGEAWDKAIARWQPLATDEGAHFDKDITIDASHLAPIVTWGTNPGMSAPITATVPGPDNAQDESERNAILAALDYMGLQPGTRIEDIALDRVFIGSCTNGRLEDLRSAAKVLRGYKVHNRVTVLVVPGSEAVKQAAEREGLDSIFTEAGAQWREPGCSMCLGMNPDILAPKQRCASTSNRNFEGRQGRGARTHLVSPAVAAAAAVAGHFVDVRGWEYRK
ncbi:MAG: 3-isopropylmalate dehydratase large subunit [Acidobacteriota bacterium]|nr:3-isopropylmalate dehydratase large subunit [Acidobacteriota bacterium]